MNNAITIEDIEDIIDAVTIESVEEAEEVTRQHFEVNARSRASMIMIAFD
jgi:DNA-binding GntR family transcriptional regulator